MVRASWAATAAQPGGRGTVVDVVLDVDEVLEVEVLEVDEVLEVEVLEVDEVLEVEVLEVDEVLDVEVLELVDVEELDDELELELELDDVLVLEPGSVQPEPVSWGRRAARTNGSVLAL